MQLRPAQLAAHLASGLRPLYVVHGDEPLLAIEAGDEIRAAARAAGFDQREILVAEPGFKWDAFEAANRNLGLFGERKLIDLTMPTGKPGAEGARVLEDCAANPSADTVTLITLPRLDRAAQTAAWFSALEQAGVSIAVYPLERGELPQWLRERPKSGFFVPMTQWLDLPADGTTTRMRSWARHVFDQFTANR